MIRFISTCLYALLLIGQAHAHTMQPAIGQLSLDGERAELTLRVNLEVILAGIDASRVTNTDDAPATQAQRYDQLRA